MIAWRAMLLAAALAMPASAQDHTLTQEDYEIVVSGKLRTLKLDFAVRNDKLAYCKARTWYEGPKAVNLMCRLVQACVDAGYRTRDTAQECVNATLDRIARDRDNAKTEKP